MAKNISLLGADYPDVPAVVLPKTGGGSAMFVDADDVNNVENALAIVVNGNTAPKAITAGQYLFIKNHSTLATGGYHATSNISSGGTVSASNVAADQNGIANSISDQITNFTWTNLVKGIKYCKKAEVVYVEFIGTNDTDLTNNSWTEIGTLPSGYRPSIDCFSLVGITSSISQFGLIEITSSGKISVFHNTGSTRKNVWGSISFPV